MSRHLVKWLAVFLIATTEVLAQSGQNFYTATNHQLTKRIGLRIGANYSFPTVTAYLDTPYRTTTLGGVTYRYGYYVGSFIERSLVDDQVSFRLDATFQIKGVGAEYRGMTTVNARYYYIGLTPQIGLQLTPHLQIYLGAEANALIDKLHPWGKTNPFELGSLLRFQYKVGKYGLEVSYFRGFTKFDTFQVGNLIGAPTAHEFYNQNAQLGLTYSWSR